MSITDVIPEATEVPKGIAADLYAVEQHLEAVRRAPLAQGTYLADNLTVHCPSTDGVDALAQEWQVEATWTKDHAAYRADYGNERIHLAAVYAPEPVVPRPDPLKLLECTTCGTRAPASQMHESLNYKPGTRFADHHAVCKDAGACTKRAFANGRVA